MFAKIIFATNVAESSFTFTGLTHVIDSGMELSSRWEGSKRCQVITKQYTTQAQVTQRVGRVGRVAPGTVYHLYSNKTLKGLKEYPDPNILSMDLTQEVLSMFTHQDLKTIIESFDQLLTPPMLSQVTCAMAMLHFYKAIFITKVGNKVEDSKSLSSSLPYSSIPWFRKSTFKKIQDISRLYNATLTPFGIVLQSVVTSLKLSPWNALLVAIGGIFEKTLDDAIILAHILEEISADVNSMFPLNADDTDVKKPPLMNNKSDHLMLMNIFKRARDISSTSADKFYMETGMSYTFWSRLVSRVEEDKVKRARDKVLHVCAKHVDDASIRMYRDAWERIGRLTDDGYSQSDQDIMKVLLLARLHHFFHACTPGNKVQTTHHIAFSGDCYKLKFQALSSSPMTPRDPLKSGIVEQIVMRKKAHEKLDELPMTLTVVSPISFRHRIDF